MDEAAYLRQAIDSLHGAIIWAAAIGATVALLLTAGLVVTYLQNKNLYFIISDLKENVIPDLKGQVAKVWTMFDARPCSQHEVLLATIKACVDEHGRRLDNHENRIDKLEDKS